MRTITPEVVVHNGKIAFDPLQTEERALIECELEKILGMEQRGLGEMASHLLTAGGKRLRPLLVLNCGLLFDGPLSELLAAAAATELIHMASLIHDDIIDGASLRRNRPSVNQLWGNHAAVLVGNFLFARAIAILSGRQLIECLNRMTESIQNMVAGEIHQANDRFNFDITIAGYYDRIAKKTAVFIKNCCESGAVIAGAASTHVENIGEYGLQIGLAFQIVDDILDYTGDPAAMGKPKWEDLINGNVTLPLILLLQDPTYGVETRRSLLDQAGSEPLYAEISKMLSQSGIVDQSYQIARNHLDKAKNVLDRLPRSSRLNFLNGLADQLESRIK